MRGKQTNKQRKTLQKLGKEYFSKFKGKEKSKCDYKK